MLQKGALTEWREFISVADVSDVIHVFVLGFGFLFPPSSAFGVCVSTRLYLGLAHNC